MNLLIASLNSTGLIEVVPMRPRSFEDQITTIQAGPFDGIILDLILSGRVNPDTNARVRYTSNSVAQGLRDVSVHAAPAIGDPDNPRDRPERGRDLPIALWSSQGNFDQFYNRESSGHDLYDARFNKSDVSSDAQTVALQLHDLAEGYRRIRTHRGRGRSGFLKMLDADDDLDRRIGDRFEVSKDVELPEHEFARYILDSLLEQPGPLIDSRLLAARLGLDPQKTPPKAWEALLEMIGTSRYRGVFGEGWPRWWWDRVARWLEGKGISPRDFRRMDAEDRVRSLRRLTAIRGLKAALPIDDKYSTKFWAICDGFETALDPINGFISTYTASDPWHDPRYISLRAAYERIKRLDGLDVHPLERQRFLAIVNNIDEATSRVRRGAKR